MAQTQHDAWGRETCYATSIQCITGQVDRVSAWSIYVMNTAEIIALETHMHTHTTCMHTCTHASIYTHWPTYPLTNNHPHPPTNTHPPTPHTQRQLCQLYTATHLVLRTSPLMTIVTLYLKHLLVKFTIMTTDNFATNAIIFSTNGMHWDLTVLPLTSCSYGLNLVCQVFLPIQ